MKNTKIQKYSVIIITVLLLMAIYYFVFVYDNKELNSPNIVDDAAQTTSTAPTAQENFNDGTEREPGNSLREDEGQGIVVDENGSIADENIPPEEEWTRSDNNELVIYQPTANNTLESGDILSGTASFETVHFRLIDNVTGVIANGQLSVINGSFAGKFDFNTTATTGRLDVFGVRDDGTEFNNVEIPVQL